MESTETDRPEAGGLTRDEEPAMDPMYLQDIERHVDDGPRGQAIQAMQSAGFPVPQILHLFAYKPARTRFLAHFTQEVLRGESPLSPGQRELIAAFTSERNHCPF